jgi:hypothetical protein
VIVEYKPAPRIRVLEETLNLKDYLVKGVKSGGVRLATREVKSVKFSKDEDEGEEEQKETKEPKDQKEQKEVKEPKQEKLDLK